MNEMEINILGKLYSKAVIAASKHPKNQGTLKNADAYAHVGSPICGDTLTAYLKIGKKKINGKEVDYIKDIKFYTMGCAVAVASTSITSESVKGKSIEDALRFSEKDLFHALGKIPPQKHHCPPMAIEALHKAIENWEKKK
jgi:nitrogen fixation NifU-like protein